MTYLFQPATQAIKRLFCAMRGHDTLLHIEQHRLSLRCVTCGHETTGWTIGEPAPRAASAPPSSRQRVGASHAA